MKPRHGARRPILIRSRTLGVGLSLTVNLAWAAGPAGIRLDGTLGGPAGVLSGPNYNITQNLGKLAGGNLFFSFQYFNVATAETALFTTTSPGIANVVSRVTGGFASTIDGTVALHAAYGSPNFFFINPSGVVFTANAKIDVPAAIYVTTADYLKFAGGNLYANPATRSTLSTAAPEAFGFLGATRAPVSITGATLGGGVQGSAAFQIAAGDVTVDGAGGESGIVNSSGAIRITAVGGTAAEVPLSGSFAATDGTVTIRDGGILFTEGRGGAAGGAIDVNAGSLQVDGTGSNTPSGIFSFAGAGNAGSIAVALGGGATLVNGGEISSATFGTGNAAPIQLQSESLTINAGASGLDTGILAAAYPGSTGMAGDIQVAVAGAASLLDGGAISSSAGGSGNAGNVAFSARSLTIDGQNSALLTGIAAETAGAGNSGRIQLQVGSLSIDGGTATNFTGISDQTFIGSSGAAGDVSVTVAGSASIVNGGEISASTNSSGNAGAISFSAQNLNIDGQASGLATGIAANTYGTGKSGSIQLQLGALSIDGGTDANFAGISSTSELALSGAAGDISVTVAGNTSIVNGGQISSGTFGAGTGGNVSLSARSVTIDGQLSSGVTGIFSSADGAGNAGSVSLTTPSLSIIGQNSNLETGIAVSAYGNGAPGRIKAQLGSLSIDGGDAAGFIGIFSQSSDGSAGSLGDVSVAVTGSASIVNGGEISSAAFGTRDAGNVALSAQSLSIDGQNSRFDTGIVADTFGAGNAGQITLQVGSLSVDGGTAAGATGVFSSAEESTGSAGGILATVAGNAAFLNGGVLSSSTSGAGNAGQVNLQSGALTLDGGPTYRSSGLISLAKRGATGAAGEVTVNVAGNTTIANGAEVSSSTFGSGDAGHVDLQTASLNIDGGASGSFTGISSDAQQSSGSAGQVVVTVSGAASLVDGGAISSSTFSAGNGGQVSVQAGSLSIDGGTSPLLTGVLSLANPGASGSAGDVSVKVTGSVSIVNGAEISSSTFGLGRAGAVALQFGSLTMTGAGSAIDSVAEPGSSGSAGGVDLTVGGAASLGGGAEISSSTFGSGNAGSVTLQSGSLSVIGGVSPSPTGIESQSNPGSTGAAGDVAIEVAGTATLEDGGVVSTSTFGPGTAGRVQFHSSSLLIDGAGSPYLTGIASSAQAGSSGAAGAISVDIAGSATLQNGGEVSTKTLGSGAAGDVSVSAGSLIIGGGSATSAITSAASATSGGQTGLIQISTGALAVTTNGAITISDAATVPHPDALTPTQISIAAGSIEMTNGLISAASTGNVAASAVDIDYVSFLRMDPSQISTSADEGNGGPITITGTGPLVVSHSNITTSVLGIRNGNGGAIDIRAPVIALDTGAIQANTAAPLASGGTVIIDAQAVVPSFESFVLAGRAVTFSPTDEGLNVVQAAAPDGVSGTLDVTAPILFLGNSLLGLTGRPYVPTPLGRGLCGFARGSSLAVAGRGGMPPSPADPLGIEAQPTPRESARDLANSGAAPAALDLRPDIACR